MTFIVVYVSTLQGGGTHVSRMFKSNVNGPVTQETAQQWEREIAEINGCEDTLIFSLTELADS